MLVCRSYADSPCWSKSMPSTSASSATRSPSVYLIASAMTVVSVPVHSDRHSRQPRTWSASEPNPPP